MSRARYGRRVSPEGLLSEAALVDVLSVGPLAGRFPFLSLRDIWRAKPKVAARRGVPVSAISAPDCALDVIEREIHGDIAVVTGYERPAGSEATSPPLSVTLVFRRRRDSWRLVRRQTTPGQ